jgi:rhodanese-related sulfurtransferase
VVCVYSECNICGDVVAAIGWLHHHNNIVHRGRFKEWRQLHVCYFRNINHWFDVNHSTIDICSPWFCCEEIGRFQRFEDIVDLFIDDGIKRKKNLVRVRSMFHFLGPFGGASPSHFVLSETHCCEVWLLSEDEHNVESHSEVTRGHRSSVDTLRGMKTLMRSLGVVGVLVMGTAACSSSDAGQSSDTTVIDVQLVPAGKVIDVRTAEEFAEGHVKGARNLDIRNGDFEKALANLDKEASYSVYCRSGNRSATAVELMRNAGFTNVVDLGAVEEAAQALALPIVQN